MYSIEIADLFCPPPPPPRFFMTPSYKLCCYIVRYYVKMMHVRLGVIKHIFPLSWGDRIDPKLLIGALDWLEILLRN